MWVSPKVWWGWRVHKAKWSRESIHSQTKEEAVSRAREIAKNQKCELVVQNKNWYISQVNSYWRDPFPPRW